MAGNNQPQPTRMELAVKGQVAKTIKQKIRNNPNPKSNQKNGEQSNTQPSLSLDDSEFPDFDPDDLVEICATLDKLNNMVNSELCI